MNRRSSLAAFAALILLPLSLAAQDPDPRALVEKASRTYQGLTSFQADFHQVIADEQIGTYESRGRLQQMGESKLAMRFSDPDGDAIVMDGAHLWVYTPSTTPRQVIRMPVPSDPTFGPNVLAWILTDAAKRYQSRYLRGDAVAGRSVDVVALTPLDRSLPFTEATVWLDRFDALPRRIEVREKSGQRRTLTFTGVETNRRFGAQAFQFTVPGGVRIVDQ